MTLGSFMILKNLMEFIQRFLSFHHLLYEVNELLPKAMIDCKKRRGKYLCPFKEIYD